MVREEARITPIASKTPCRAVAPEKFEREPFERESFERKPEDAQGNIQPIGALEASPPARSLAALERRRPAGRRAVCRPPQR